MQQRTLLSVIHIRRTKVLRYFLRVIFRKILFIYVNFWCEFILWGQNDYNIFLDYCRSDLALFYQKSWIPTKWYLLQSNGKSTTLLHFMRSTQLTIKFDVSRLFNSPQLFSIAWIEFEFYFIQIFQLYPYIVSLARLIKPFDATTVLHSFWKNTIDAVERFMP